MTNSGIKFDQNKEPLDLISYTAIFELAKVLEFGKKKYSSWNWSKGLSYSRILAAMLRHAFKYMAGEDKDPETGLSHIAHVMCCCMFILHFEKFRPDLDDREKDAFKIPTLGVVSGSEQNSMLNNTQNIKE